MSFSFDLFEHFCYGIWGSKQNLIIFTEFFQQGFLYLAYRRKDAGFGFGQRQ